MPSRYGPRLTWNRTAWWAAALALAACDSPTTLSYRTTQVGVDSTVVSSQDVSPDPTRTYEYRSAQVRPDSLLLDLWHQGIYVQKGWYPLGYRCEDPIGPRLTVQLPGPDARMVKHGFNLGTGRLGCAANLTQYVLNVLG